MSLAAVEEYVGGADLFGGPLGVDQVPRWRCASVAVVEGPGDLSPTTLVATNWPVDLDRFCGHDSVDRHTHR